MAHVRYIMHGSGHTTGAITRRDHRWDPGDEIAAPEGEFRHLSAGVYSTRPMRPTPSTTLDETASEDEGEEAPYTLGVHKGGGWYYVLRGGERVVEDGEEVLAGQGKDAAQAQIDDLNTFHR